MQQLVMYSAKLVRSLDLNVTMSILLSAILLFLMTYRVFLSRHFSQSIPMKSMRGTNK